MDAARIFAGPHRCRYCPESYSTPDKLQRHVAHRHPWVRRARFGALAGGSVFVVALLAIVAFQPGPQPDPLAAFEVEGNPLLGSRDAPIQVVLIESPSCADCAWFHQDVLPGTLANKTRNGVLAVWFVTAVTSAPMDHAAAVAQECSYRHAGTKGFLDFTADLFANQSRLDEHVVHVMLQDFAARSDIPEETVMRCYYAEETGAMVDADDRVASSHDAPPGTAFLIEGDHVERMTLREFASWLGNP